MSVSNLIGPFMVYLDRFLIGALVSAAAVAYYTTPYELVTKLWLFPGAVLTGVFPSLAMLLRSDAEAARSLFARGTRFIFVMVFPPALLLTAFSQEGLSLWLGKDFALESAPVVVWLTLGVFINCLGQAPFALVQAAGRPDITARLHLIELPLYVLLIYWLLPRYGIVGAAQAWALRAIVDTVLLFMIAGRVAERQYSMGRWFTAGGAAACVLFLVSLPESLVARGGLSAALLLLFSGFSWQVLLGEAERYRLKGVVNGVRAKLRGCG